MNELLKILEIIKVIPKELVAVVCLLIIILLLFRILDKFSERWNKSTEVLAKLTTLIEILVNRK
uniref:Holin n=1 Tax=viral metagenome TaxID=1070528 RepID=A0A6M3LMZ5_9ZZZZ